jgi:hypothetical protein
MIDMEEPITTGQFLVYEKDLLPKINTLKAQDLRTYFEYQEEYKKDLALERNLAQKQILQTTPKSNWRSYLAPVAQYLAKPKKWALGFARSFL